MSKRRSNLTKFIAALVFATIVGIGLFVYDALREHSLQYDYLIWNLFLAWLPLLFATQLNRSLRNKLWSSWEGLTWSVLWLLFLPNSFYMISDFIHLRSISEQYILYATVMFTSFIYTAVALGFSSLYLIHLRLRRRSPKLIADICIAFVMLICSFGIYIGRDLRWNSWNILTNPGGLLFDIFDRLQHPNAYPDMLLTVITFFVLLLSMYGLLWRGIKMVREPTSVQIAAP